MTEKLFNETTEPEAVRKMREAGDAFLAVVLELDTQAETNATADARTSALVSTMVSVVVQAAAIRQMDAAGGGLRPFLEGMLAAIYGAGLGCATVTGQLPDSRIPPLGFQQLATGYQYGAERVAGVFGRGEPRN